MADTDQPARDREIIKAYCTRRVDEYFELVEQSKHTIVLDSKDAKLWFWEGQTAEEIHRTKVFLVAFGIAAWAGVPLMTRVCVD